MALKKKSMFGGLPSGIVGGDKPIAAAPPKKKVKPRAAQKLVERTSVGQHFVNCIHENNKKKKKA